MDKQKLYESIMHHVGIELKKALRKQQINEGFKDWKETNVPKLDQNEFMEKVNLVFTTFAQLMQEKEITGVALMYIQNAKANVLKRYEVSDLISIAAKGGIAKRFLIDIKAALGEDADADKLVPFINNTFFSIDINPEKHLVKYLNDIIDPVQRNCVKDMQYIKVSFESDANNNKRVRVKISMRALLEKTEEIEQLFN